jgi:FtsZ-interacting cell division protein ZipA
MSDLLIILVVLGVLIVVGVVVFNWWQERKFQSKVSHDFKPTKRDVLIEDFQINTSAIKKEKSSHANERKESTFSSTYKEPSVTGKREPEVDLFEFTQPEVYEADAVAETVFASELTNPTLPASSNLKTSGIQTGSTQTDPSEVSFDTAVNDASQDLDLPDEGEYVAESARSTPFKTKSEDAFLPEALHTQIDLMALLFASIPLTQPKALSVIQTQFKEFNERNFSFGLSHTDEWVALADSKPEAMFSKLVFSLQLADRGGSVSRATLNRFQHMVETIGLELSAHVEWQGAGDPLNAAVTLDQFCIEVDKTVGFHLMTHQGAAFHATKLRGLMEAQGLLLGADGKFHLFHPQIKDLIEFSVKNYEGNPFSAEMLKNSVMHGVTFQLDIPTVKNSADVFDRMIVMAKTLAKQLDAGIVDDNRKELGDLQLEKIRQQLKMINATMIAKGIIPGSPQALRLFS